MTWQVVNKLFDLCRNLPHVAPCFLGCCLIRAWLGIALVDVQSCEAVTSWLTIDGRTIFRVGEVIAFLTIPILVSRRADYHTSGFGLPTCLVLAVAGGSTIAFHGAAPVPDALLVVGILAGGAAYAAILLLWLELYGCMSTQYAVLAWSGSYLVNFAIWCLLQACDEVVSTACLFVLPAASLVFAVLGFRKISPDHLPHRHVRTGGTPWLLILWVGTFGFFYGLGDGLTGLAFSTLPARVGMALPAILAVVGIMLGLKRFDLKLLVMITVLGMMLGLVTMLILRGDVIVSQVFMSSANESYLMLAYAFACSLAYRLGQSNIRACGLIGGANILCIQLGAILGVLFAGAFEGSRVLGTAIGIISIVVILVVSLASVYNRDYLDSLTLDDGREDATTKELLSWASEQGLSPKELAVFRLLIRGMSAPEMAEELFLAPSTVRAHTSNIYRKLDVHTRREFDGIVASRTGGA